MRNHIEKVLRIGCIALGALLLFQVVRIVKNSNPLAKLTIPAVPTLDGTNAVTSISTNAPAAKGGTNAPIASAKVGSTNAVSTNATVALGTNTVSAKPVTMEKAAKPEVETNSLVAVVPLGSTNETVSVGGTDAGTNSAAIRKLDKIGTNGVAVSEVSTNGTNAVVKPGSKKSPRPEMAIAGMPGMIGGKAAQAELPPAVKARVDRIYESELFGTVMRPMPAALMGIAGNSAFLRTSSGQTGLVKEGDSLGEMKLLRIGVNRVLVEEKGEKKELMIFNGYGGESLMAKQKDTPDETTSK